MSTRKTNETVPAIVKQLEGKSSLEQIETFLEFSEILNDAFNYTCQSNYFLSGEARTRTVVSTLETAIQFVTRDVMKGLLNSLKTGVTFDWEKFEIHDAVSDCAYDLHTYFEYSTAFLTVFDCFFSHDSVKEGSPDEFIQKALQTRNFFLFLLGNALFDNIGVSVKEK